MNRSTQEEFEWGHTDDFFDEILKSYGSLEEFENQNEAQTRFQTIDRVIREYLGWQYGQIQVEDFVRGPDKQEYLDYLLISGDTRIIIEAKKSGVALATPSRAKKLKIEGSVLTKGDVNKAIKQADSYAKSKNADVVIITNGACWIYYSMQFRTSESVAHLLFPFDRPEDQEKLLKLFSNTSVGKGSLDDLTGIDHAKQYVLVEMLKQKDHRIGRNDIADHLTPALNLAMYSESLITNPDSLRYCFVKTDARTKFDNQLGVYFSDYLSQGLRPAKRVKKNAGQDVVEKMVRDSQKSFAPPLTALIGSVGTGKTTYLKHFEELVLPKISQDKDLNWIYIDFEALGPSGNPKEFMYSKIKDYIQTENACSTSYESVVLPSYTEEFNKMKRGPWHNMAKESPNEFSKVCDEIIQKEYHEVYPYVDKILSYLSSRRLCVVVLDNVDLYEDSSIEAEVFTEGLALSKRTKSHVFVSLRDVTYVRHKSNATFDAYEIRRIWLDPPPFKEVLSKRFTYAKKILEGVSCEIGYTESFRLTVPNLADFFDIIQQSLLEGNTGHFIECITDSNIRKGISYMQNFLTSGHVHADRAVDCYLKGQRKYTFPFHEVFKGCIYAQWMYFQESRCDSINLLDSRVGSKNLLLLRWVILRFLVDSAKIKTQVNVEVLSLEKFVSSMGCDSATLITVLNDLSKHGLLKEIDSDTIKMTSKICITKSGAYYANILVNEASYVEACALDTSILNAEIWQKLVDISHEIEDTSKIAEKMRKRHVRLRLFCNYIIDSVAVVENDISSVINKKMLVEWRNKVSGELKRAHEKIKRQKKKY